MRHLIGHLSRCQVVYARIGCYTDCYIAAACLR